MFAALEGSPVDRVPIWLLFPYHRVGYYADVRTNPAYKAIFEASREAAIMLDRRGFNVPLFTPDVEHNRESGNAEGWNTTRDTLKFKDIQLYSETRRAGSEVRIRKTIDSEEDLLQYCQLPICTDRRTIFSALEKQLPQYLKEKSEFPRDYGAMMLDLGEPIGPVYSSSNLSEYPIWSVTRPDEVADLLDRLMQRYRLIYEFCLERELADVYFLVGSELASPPMVSRSTFQRWIVPYAREIIAMIHSAGKKVIQHYHGQIREVLPDFLEMAPDGLHTIEAPPTGNCTMTQAYEITGDRITLIGNIQYDCFRSYTPDEMRAAVRELIEECRGRRFILSPSAGPYEDVISESMQHNYLEFMKAGLEYGKGR